MEQDAIYQAALARIEALSHELERLEALVQEKRELEAFVTTFRRLAGFVGEASSCAMSAHGQTQKASSTEEIIDAAMSILSKRGPLKLGTLYDALIAEGIVIGGKIPRNNLGAKLSADPRLESHKDIGWWFAHESLPSSVLPEVVELRDAIPDFPVIHGAPVNGTLGSV